MLFSIHTLSLLKCLLKPLAYFLIGLFVCLLLSFTSSLCTLNNSLLSDVFCKYFLIVCGFSFYSPDSVVHGAEKINFNKAGLSIISFMDGAFMLYLKSHCQMLSCLDFLLSSRNFVVWHFTFRSMIHLELIVGKGIMSVSVFIYLLCGCPDFPVLFVEKILSFL
jgi:hypothetical protein